MRGNKKEARVGARKCGVMRERGGGGEKGSDGQRERLGRERGSEATRKRLGWNPESAG